MKTILTIAMLVIATAPASALQGADLINELSSELEECYVYYHLIEAMMRSEAQQPEPYAPRDQILASADGYAKAANQYGELALKAGKQAGLSDEAFEARAMEYSDMMEKLTNKSWVNISVLNRRYDAFCKMLGTDPAGRVLELTAGHICDGSYTCR